MNINNYDIKVWLLEKLQEELQSDPQGGSSVYSKEWTRVNEEYAEYARRGMHDSITLYDLSSRLHA